MVASDRRQIEHRVEGRDLEHADLRHVEHLGDDLDGPLGDPAGLLLLRFPQQRDDSGSLPAFRILCDLRLRPGEILRRKGEVLRLNAFVCEATNGH
jgi:hypothetical protein